jgi:ABC-type amino acid transport substrate-binding protein
VSVRGGASLAGALLTVVLLLPGVAGAASPEADDGSPLRVAVRSAPPFAMRDGDRWEGLSVELWEEVAEGLGREFTWVEMPLEETLDALAEGSVDVAVAALTLTADRERRIDFSHAYFVSGLSLAHVADGGSAWLLTLRGFFSPEFLGIVGTLALVLLAAGFLLWIFERRPNAEQFGQGKVLRGLGDGFWWSAVTMTTVGYGDKAPRTLGGRLVALIWMFTSLILVAGFTAAIAASLTANRLEADPLRGRGLPDLTVGVLDASAAAAFAADQGAVVRRFGSVEAALEALEAERVDAVLHDAPILRHLARTSFRSIEVAPQVLVRDDYGFGLRPGSPLREAVNAALLTTLHEPSWERIRRRHLGEGASP